MIATSEHNSPVCLCNLQSVSMAGCYILGVDFQSRGIYNVMNSRSL